nr:histone deacetylase 9-like [Arachis hypogaea]
MKEIGEKEGKYYAIDVPFKDGIDDPSFSRLFKTIISKVVETYQPGAIVLQCGAYSLVGDRLGCFNLSIDGCLKCIWIHKMVRSPCLMLLFAFSTIMENHWNLCKFSMNTQLKP